MVDYFIVTDILNPRRSFLHKTKETIYPSRIGLCHGSWVCTRQNTRSGAAERVFLISGCFTKNTTGIVYTTAQAQGNYGNQP
jgi:hypothetical protein